MNEDEIDPLDQARGIVAAHSLELAEQQRRNLLRVLNNVCTTVTTLTTELQVKGDQLRQRLTTLRKRDSSDQPTFETELNALTRETQNLHLRLVTIRPHLVQIRGALAIILWQLEG